MFIEGKYFIIIDRATGSATGNLGIHFQLREDSKPIFNEQQNTVATTYADGNNLLIQSFSGKLKQEPGKVSYEYRKEVERPAFVFEKQKDASNAYFISVVYPFDGHKIPVISLSENAGNDIEIGKLNITLVINGVKKEIKADLDK